MHSNCILLVEDDDNDVFFLRHAFSEADVANPVQLAKDGKQAMEYLSGEGRFSDREIYPLPCLVLLDLKLPRSSGMDLLEWIRRQPALKRTVVIIHTSSNNEEDVDRAYELGANSFVVKPCGVNERLQMVKHLKGWWLSYNTFSTVRGTCSVPVDLKPATGQSQYDRTAG